MLTRGRVILACMAFFCLSAISETSANATSSLSSRRFNAPTQRFVRVKLLRLPLPLEIEGKDIIIRASQPKDFSPVALVPSEKWKIDRKRVEGHKLWIARNQSEIVRTSQDFLLLHSSYKRIRILGYEFPSPLMLSAESSQSSVDVIAVVNFEEYLENVLLSEMPSSWPLEALKAQAVSTRSYALYQMEARQKDAFQLEANVSDQAFAFHGDTPAREKIRRALAETQGEVIEVNGHVAKAYFHSDCGGQTEESGRVWGSGDNTKDSTGTAVDKFCPYSPHGRWTLELSLDELQSKLEESGKSLGGLKTLNVAGRTPSHRVALVAVNGDEGHLLVSGNELRKLVGYERLRSTMFDVSVSEGIVKFTGRGFGHGSGLCQWGARIMAERGQDFRKILRHYYPKAQIRNLQPVPSAPKTAGSDLAINL